MQAFQAITTQRLSDEVVAQIQQMLLEGKLRMGDRLPPEREMARQLRVSRSALREALSILETLGIIERRKSGGAFVRKLNSDDVLDKIVSPSTKSDKELFEDLLEVREVLESKALEWAIERATKQDLNRIERALDMLADPEKSAIEADILFHLYISAATRNEILFKLTRNIGDMLRDIREKTLNQPGRREECLIEHHHILATIKNGHKVEGIRAMIDHIHKVEGIVEGI